MQKKIIIIGSTSGIGRQLAELYVERGDKVGITGRRIELLKQLQEKFSTKIEYECFDVTGNDNIFHIEKLINKLDGLDILIISAGTGQASKELSWEIDKTTIDTNVKGFIEIANWGFNFFLKQGYGQLAAISSVAANRGGVWAPAYNASKAFQSTYMEGLAMKAKKSRNISITNIEPGFVKTKMAGHKVFWVVPVEKAARQIVYAIDKRKRKVYISKRWWLIVQLMKWVPFWILKRIE